MAKPIAYGHLKLKPNEFYEMDLNDFEDMRTAHEQAETERRWEMAYWVCNMISPHLGKGKVSVNSLVKPFLPKKEIVRTKEECENFFEDFYKQRKEVMEDGNDSRVSG
jgi:hypothetical protein